MNHVGKVFVSRLLSSCAIAVVLGATARADVTLQERISVNGEGVLKMVNMSGTTTTTIAGDRARTDSNLQFESGLVRAFARGVGQSAEIVRLDQDKIYSLDTRKKTYTETTFAARRAQMQEAMQKMQEGQAQQQQQASGVDESQCEWSDPKAEVKRTGEKALIGGFQAEHVNITATQACKDKETGQVCEFGLTLDQWLAPEFDAAEEALAYQRAYAQKLGLDASASGNFAERAESMFGRYKGIWGEVAAKMHDVKGYPVKSSFGLGVGGPQCQSVQQAQASDGDSETSSGVGKALGGAVGGALGGALGGLFGRKKKEEPPVETATPPPSTPGGLIPLMSVSTELVSVSHDAADAQVFEIPADFTKEN